MAPTICLQDISMPRGDAACPYSRPKQRNRPNGISGKQHHVVELRQMSLTRARGSSAPYNETPPGSPISEPDRPIDACFPNSPESSLCARIPIDREDQWRAFMKRREGLLNIVARTVLLIRRNHILEKKVEALRLETRSFINEVLNNPENRILRERRQQLANCNTSIIDNNISSSTSEKQSWPTEVINVEKSRTCVCTDQTIVASTCNSPNTDHQTQSSNSLVH